MSKTIYYIGAGASCGKRDRAKSIIEGILLSQRLLHKLQGLGSILQKQKSRSRDILLFMGSISGLMIEVLISLRTYLLHGETPEIKKTCWLH